MKVRRMEAENDGSARDASMEFVGLGPASPLGAGLSAKCEGCWLLWQDNCLNANAGGLD